MTEWTILAGAKGNVRSMSLNRSQFNGLLRLRRPSHLRHNFATCRRSSESLQIDVAEKG